jgi:hypothetical protein
MKNGRKIRGKLDSHLYLQEKLLNEIGKIIKNFKRVEILDLHNLLTK